MKIISVLLLGILLFSSCDEHFEENKLYGYYVPIGYKNTFDTIELKSRGIYHRKVYDKDNKLVLKMDGKWKFENNHNIIFNTFYLNLDDNLIKFPHLVRDTSMEMNTYFETHKGKVQFCVGDQQRENCYQKIK